MSKTIKTSNGHQFIIEGDIIIGNTIIVTVIPVSGYVFIGWDNDYTNIVEIENDDNGNQRFEITITECGVSFDALIEAKSQTYKVELNVDGEGSVTGGGNYSSDTEVTIVAIPNNTCVQFKGWFSNDSIISNGESYTFTVIEDVSYTAKFERYKVTLTVQSSDENQGTVTPNGEQEYDCGTEKNIEATAKEGYTFSYWEFNDEQLDSNPLTVVLDSDAEYTAYFIANKYNITTAIDLSGVTTTSGDGSYDYNQTATVSVGVFDLNIYEFDGWYVNNSKVSSNTIYQFIVNGDRHLIAKFKKREYNITTSVEPDNGGTASGGGIFNYGDSVTLVATSQTGYEFVNWTKNGIEVSTNSNFIFNVYESANYIANFKAKMYTIRTISVPELVGNLNGGGVYNVNTSIALSVNSFDESHYNFDGWYLNNVRQTTELNYNIIVTQNLTYEARFVPKSFELVVKRDGPEHGYVEVYDVNDELIKTINNNTNTDNVVSVPYNTQLKLKAINNNGFVFVRWLTPNGDNFNSLITILVDNDVEYWAGFAMNSREINVNVNPHDKGTATIIDNGDGDGLYEDGEQVTLSITPNSGYELFNWVKNGSQVSTDLGYQFIVDNNSGGTYTANLGCRITSSVSPNNGGEITTTAINQNDVRDNNLYLYGTTVTLVATPQTGYEFVNWTKNSDVVSTNNNITFVVSESANYIANFEKKKFNVNLKVYKFLEGTTNYQATTNAGVTSVSPGVSDIEYGSSLSLNASPNNGFVFDRWEITENGDTYIITNSSYIITTLTSNIEISCYYKELLVYKTISWTNPIYENGLTGSIICSVNGNNVVSGTSLPIGTEVTLYCTPGINYVFKNWVNLPESYTNGVNNGVEWVKFNLNEDENVSAICYPIVQWIVPQNGNITAEIISGQTSQSLNNGGDVQQGCVVRLTCQPNTGYMVSDAYNAWSGLPNDANITNNNTQVEFFVKTPLVNIMVNILPITYSVYCDNYTENLNGEYNQSNNGGTTVVNGAINHGDNLTITCTPNTNYELDKIVINGQTINNTLTYTLTNVQSDVHIESYFKLVQHTLNVRTNNGVAGLVSIDNSTPLENKSKLIKHGGSATIEATPTTIQRSTTCNQEIITRNNIPAYKFDSWDDNNSNPNRRINNIESDINLQANFIVNGGHEVLVYGIVLGNDTNDGANPTLTPYGLDYDNNPIPLSLSCNNHVGWYFNGEEVTLKANAGSSIKETSNSAELKFESWSDGSTDLEHNITISADSPTDYIGYYSKSYGMEVQYQYCTLYIDRLLISTNNYVQIWSGSNNDIYQTNVGLTCMCGDYRVRVEPNYGYRLNDSTWRGNPLVFNNNSSEINVSSSSSTSNNVLRVICLESQSVEILYLLTNEEPNQFGNLKYKTDKCYLDWEKELNIKNNEKSKYFVLAVPVKYQLINFEMVLGNGQIVNIGDLSNINNQINGNSYNIYYYDLNGQQIDSVNYVIG